MQFISEGLSRGERGIVLSTDIPEREILESADALGYRFSEHEDDLQVLDYLSNRPDNLNEVSIALHKAVQEYCRIGLTRIAVDSLSTLAIVLGNDGIAPWVLQQRARLGKLPTATLFTYDPSIHPPMLKLALQNVLNGTIELQVSESSDGSLQRQLRIFNLRSLSHSTRWRKFEVVSHEGVRFLDTG
jgi:KaiC/GvpD/RAD55 family RecA-like ATPase